MRTLSSVDVRMAGAGDGGTLEFHLDGVGGPLVATVKAPLTGGWQRWTTVTAPVAGATGVHGLYIVFKGSTGVGNLNWFRFR